MRKPNQALALPELWTAERVAEWLSVSRKAVYNMVNRGEIPAQCVVKIGSRLRFDAALLGAWLAEKRSRSHGVTAR